jgi:hypothetical protein
MKFLVEARVKPAETLCQLSSQCREEAGSITYWYSKFPEGLPHAHVQPTAVHDGNIRGIKELIFGNR